jgi:hypothetical protein
MRTGNIMIGATVKSRKDIKFNKEQLRIEKKMLAENSRNRISEKYTLEIRKRNLLELISRL